MFEDFKNWVGMFKNSGNQISNYCNVEEKMGRACLRWVTLYIMYVSTRARAFNQVLWPGGTPTARLTVANQLFRIGCSGIKVDTICTSVYPPQPHPRSRTMASFDFCNKVYTCAHNNSNIHKNNKKHAANILRECTIIFSLIITGYNNIIL